MKTSYMKLAAALITGMMALTSCSDVEIPEAANAGLSTVTDLNTSVDGRLVTISWSPVAGAVSYRVYRNDNLVAETTETTYSEKVGYSTDYKWTVKYVDAAGLVSLGQTTGVINVAKPDVPDVKGANTVGYLLVTSTVSELPEAERIAAEWFQTNYVDKGEGAFVSLAALPAITKDQFAALWIHFDRLDIEVGYQNLPLDNDAISAIQDYYYDGGNLYLSKMATQVITAVGRCTMAPNLFYSGEGSVGGDVWYCNAQMGTGGQWQYDRRSHQVFRGMTADNSFYTDHSAYPLIGMTFRTDHNCMWDLNACGLAVTTNTIEAWEQATTSTVLGTWGQVVDYCCAGIVDFAPSGAALGRALCNGLAAYQFTSDNQYADNIFQMTKNSLDYVRGYQEPMAAYLLTEANVSDLPEAERIAAELFQSEYVDKGTGAFITPSQLVGLDYNTYPALWIHFDRLNIEQGYQNLPLTEAQINGLKEYAEDGGNILLTKHATQLAAGIGRVSNAPNLFNSSEGSVGGDVWYCNAQMGTGGQWQYDRRSHAIFEGMTADETFYSDHTAYPLIGMTFRTDHNCMWDLNACGLAVSTNTIDAWEQATNSTVLGTWGQVVDYCCAGIVDFNPDGAFSGRILCNGLAAYQFTSDNQYADNVNRMTLNSVNYLLK